MWSLAAWVTSSDMLLRAQLVAHPGEHEVDDLGDLLDRQRAEHDRRVDAVEELRAEVLLQLVRDLLLHELVRALGPGGVGRALDAEAEAGVRLELLRAEVAGHDDDAVAEVDPAALGVRQVPVLEDLQQDVEDLRMGLLDLVEEHDAVVLAADGLGQLAALVEADVAGRRADEPRHVVALHELAHVDLDERVLAAEHELGERLGELGLPDAGRAEEDERADRALRVLEAGAGAADGLRDGLDRLLLADDPAVEGVLHVQQPLGLLLGDAGDRDAGPHRHDLGDLLLADRRLVAGHRAPATRCAASSTCSLAVASASRSVAASSYSWLLIAASFSLVTRSRSFCASRRAGGADAWRRRTRRGGLVDEVDRLVRQVAIGDVADRQVGRGLDRLVGDRDLVVLLVALADAHQDVDGLLEGRLLDHDRLEAALEGGVALDVLAVLVERRRADALELAARQRRLEDVRRVDRALGRAGADERVQLVDEEDRVVGVAQLLDDLLEPLLELAAVLGAGDERPDVERQDALVQQDLGDVAGDDPMGEALGDGRLADAGLADEGRVVLRLAAEDLDDPLDLLLAADDRDRAFLRGRRP